MQNTMDLAVVNLPLSARGNIDAQLDRYVANMKRQAADKAKAISAQFKADKEKAKALRVSEDAKVMAKVAATKAKYPEHTTAGILATVDGWVKSQPAKFIKWMAM